MSQVAQHQSEEDTLPKFSPRRPLPRSRPAVETSITLVLHSALAILMVRGRQATKTESPSLGLTGFNRDLIPVWKGVIANDPYADWWLVQVEEQLEMTSRRIAEATAQLRRVIDEFASSSDRPFKVLGSQSPKPVAVEFAFTTPYSFRAAGILQDFDAFLLQTLTARNFSLLTEKQRRQQQHDEARSLRTLFHLPSRYKSTGTTRKNLGSAQAKDARQAMGDVPEEVLCGERRAIYAPPLPVDALESVA